MSQPQPTPVPATMAQLGEFHKVPEEPVDLSETELRYAGYAGRIAAVLRGVASSPATRYLAYTSDVGEGFRPVVNIWFVRACYGVSWLYVGIDSFLEARRRYTETQENTNEALRSGSQRLVFNGLASMVLPMFTIHTVVHQSGNLFKKMTNIPAPVAKWAPVALGLAVVPALPYMFDHPVETAVESMWDKFWPTQFPTHKHHADDSSDVKVQTAISAINH